MDQPPSKKMKLEVPPPTPQELNNLKEAETLFHSNLFRLQVEEMMKEVKIKVKRKKNLDRFLESLKLEICSIKPSESYTITDDSWLRSESIKIPIFQEQNSDKGKFEFHPPASIRPIGSYALDSACSKTITIDFAIEMPKQCWQQTDYLNHRYHRKRAMFLAYLAQELNASSLVEDLKFSFHNGCHMKPVLLLTPKGVCGKHFVIRLMPYPGNAIKISRFYPSKSNVRMKWFFNENSDESFFPTPKYNSTILTDLMIPELADFLQETVSSPNIRDGIILLKVWCVQRGFSEGFGGFNGFVISMLVAYLLKNRKLNPRMSSYQVFRVTLLFIGKHKWGEESISLCKDQLEDKPTIEDFRQLYDVVFLDPSGCLNIFANMKKETLSMICHEAQLGIRILDGGLSDSFSLLFLTKLPFCQKFDYLLHVSNTYTEDCVQRFLGSRENALDYGNNAFAYIESQYCKILLKALGQRVTFIDVKRNEPDVWPISESSPNPNELKTITFGLLLNQDNAFNPLENGPVSEDPKAEEFRNFWGEKSDLRRFKDGSIREAVLWKTRTDDDRRNIIGSIAMHVLKRHANVDPNNVHLTGNNVLSALHLSRSLFYSKIHLYGTGEEDFLKMLNSFDTLNKKLMNLKDFPLIISSIQGASSSFRFCEVFPPMMTKHIFEDTPAWAPALKAVITFEGSGKWPDEVEAIRMLKSKLYVELTEVVNSQLHLHAYPTETDVYILMDGYVFQLEIAVHKEIFLLKQIKLGTKKTVESTEIRDLELSTQILPKLNGVLHGFHQQHSSYGTACRLAKRWISCQLLHDYIREEVIELLVASLYVRPEPYSCPSCPQIAFHRLLSLLSTHDWKISPVIVNLNNTFTKEEMSEMQSSFISHRTTLPPMVIIIPQDTSGTLWTKASPKPTIMHRLITVARSALESLERKMYQPRSDFMQIFRPPLNAYDVIIYLNPYKVPKRHLSLELPKKESCRVIKSYSSVSDDLLPDIGDDPVQLYLEALRVRYGDYALFFYDAFGGDYIAVVWIPKEFEKIPFQISRIGCRMEKGVNADKTVLMVPNIEYMLEDFHSIALTIDPDLFDYLEKRTESWTIS